MNLSNFSDLIKSVSTLLELTPEEIKTKYKNNTIKLIDTHLEIRLNKEQVTLSCTFDQNNRCNSIYLFPDKTEIKDKEKHITYLSQTYPYDLLNNCWELPNSILKIQDSLNDIKFVIYG